MIGTRIQGNIRIHRYPGRRLPILMLACLMVVVSPLSIRAAAREQESDPAWSEFGVIDAGTYESPQFGYTIEWSAPWILDDSIPFGPAYSDDNPARPMDILWLETRSDNALLTITGNDFDSLPYTDPDSATEEFIGYWSSGAVLANRPNVASREVLLTDYSSDNAAIITLQTTASGTQEVIYTHLRLLPDGETVVSYSLAALARDFLLVYDVASAVTLDGDDMCSFVDVKEVRKAIEAATEDRRATPV
jgi:hypothetical protein